MVGRPLMRLRNMMVGAVVCVVMLVAAQSAFAVSAAQNGYSFPAGSIQQQIGTAQHEPKEAKSTESEPAAAASSKLPFTGLDVGLVVGAGGVLLAMGFGIRRLSRSEVA